MKKIPIIFSIFLLFFLAIQVTFASCIDNCTVEDDEYCIYNECYFDKCYRDLKLELCLNDCEEDKIDRIYRTFKENMEIQCDRYTKQKTKVLEMIARDYKTSDPCYKHELDNLKSTKTYIKTNYRVFLDEISECFNKCQRKTLRKFVKREKRKIKKILKYAAVYKFPCLGGEDCENCTK